MLKIFTLFLKFSLKLPGYMRDSLSSMFFNQNEVL